MFSLIIGQYNNKIECFRLHGKDVQITVEDAHRILRLPIGVIDIETLYVRGGSNEKLEKELNNMIR